MKYYIVTEGKIADIIYDSQQPCCLAEPEVQRLSKEWETNLFAYMHEASRAEIETYGVYEV